ncbi:MAG: hypothetical protein D6828_05290, partial [Nitrospirae bacterium]
MNRLRYPVPYRELLSFQEKLDLKREEFDRIRPFTPAFLKKSREFAEYLHSVFINIPETKRFIENERYPGFLKEAWQKWFEYIFTHYPDKMFYEYLWRMGLSHAEVDLDQRYSNLGFSLVRCYCHNIIKSEIPMDKKAVVAEVVDKIIDLCLLVETNAYIAGTVRCEQDIIFGISDGLRNPVMIIGGLINRLKKDVKEDDPKNEIYETIIYEIK